MKPFANSEMCYGSFSRGDSDAMSDRDILIVDDDVNILQNRAKELEKAGWSVGSYTFSKLEHLSTIGALFIQHLKCEGNLLRDEAGRLKKLLNRFKPRKDYGSEIELNFSLIKIATNRPNVANGSLWAADVLYVAVRNWGIMKLAEQGRHVYSFSSVLENLTEFNFIDERSIGHLLQLRLAKALYRSCENVPVNHAETWINNAINHLPHSFPFFRFTAIPSMEILEKRSSFPLNLPVYHRLRNVEKTYIAASTLLPDIKQRSDFERVRRWIINPRAYSSFAALNEAETDELFGQIMDDIKFSTTQRVLTSS